MAMRNLFYRYSVTLLCLVMVGDLRADDRDILVGVLRNRQQCGLAETKALIAKTLQSLAGGSQQKEIERLQLLHAACGSYLKENDAETYQLFHARPQWISGEEWRTMIVDDKSFATVVHMLREHMKTPAKLCSFAGSLGRYLEQIAAHDIVRSIICYACQDAFEKTKDYRAKGAVCGANFFDGIASLLQEKDCKYIAEAGRMLKTLPGPLKNRVAKTCEPYFLGLTPKEDDVIHPQAWAAVSYATADKAYDRRHQLLLKNEDYKKSLLFDDDE